MNNRHADRITLRYVYPESLRLDMPVYERAGYHIRAFGFEGWGFAVHLLHKSASQYPRPYVEKRLAEAIHQLGTL